MFKSSQQNPDLDLNGSEGIIQGDQLNMTVCMEPWKATCPMSIVWLYLLYNGTLDKSLFTGGQKNTAMFNWFGLYEVERYLLTLESRISVILALAIFTPSSFPPTRICGSFRLLAPIFNLHELITTCQTLSCSLGWNN